MNFKVGDKVRCIDDSYSTVYGLHRRRSYRVILIALLDKLFIKGNGVQEDIRWNADRFEKVVPNGKR